MMGSVVSQLEVTYPILFWEPLFPFIAMKWYLTPSW